MKYLGIIFCTLTFVLSFSSCRSTRGGMTARYLDDGYQKPKIAVIPVKDLVEQKAYASDNQWDIASEITDEIYERLSKYGELIVLSKEQAQWMETSNEHHVQTHNQNCDFKVEVELVDHKTIPYERGAHNRIYPMQGRADHLIQMRYRLTVQDMRPGRNGRIVLRELQESFHPVALDESDINYDRIDKQETYYKRTPLGRGHARLADEIAKRLSDYLPYLERL